MTALRVVLAGGPGAGKTTVLDELARRGWAVRPDTARALIAERQQAGLPPRPAPAEFARQVLARDLAQLQAVASGCVFFDRCALDALGMLQGLGGMTATEEALLRSLVLARPESSSPSSLQAPTPAPFHRSVFVLPPWREIYVTDAQRDHDFAHAERVHAGVNDWYRRCGYTTVSVAPGPVAARADAILQRLRDDGVL